MPSDKFNALLEIAADQMGLVTLDDAREAGYSSASVAQLARRRQLERVSNSVYRVPSMAGAALTSYLAAALWPRGTRGVLSHETALDLWDVTDVNPSKIHITVPKAHRVRRRLPDGYRLHHEDLRAQDIDSVEGIPVVTLARAIRQCAEDSLGLDLLEQAARHGHRRGLLSDRQLDGLERDLGLRAARARA